jgi:VanZ family protein
MSGPMAKPPASYSAWRPCFWPSRCAVLSLNTLLGYNGNMTHKVIAATAWACLTFIVYVTLSSIDARPELVSVGFYKAFCTVVERFAAYAVLGLLFYLAYPRHAALVCLLVFGSAVILELLQAFIPDRDARVIDALEKLAGGAVGIVAARAFLAFTERKTQSMPSRTP